MTTTSNKPTKAASAKKKATRSAAGKVKGTAEARILSALAHELTTGEKAPSKARIAILADMASNEGSYKTMCGILRRKGLVDYNKDTIWLSEAGLQKVEPELGAAPKTNADIHEKIKERLKMKKARDIFDFLADGQARSFEEIAQAIGVDAENASLKTYMTCVTKYTDKTKGPNGEKMYALNKSCFPFN